jgi:HAD superfamily hydrolase (TIGR01549 family)
LTIPQRDNARREGVRGWRDRGGVALTQSVALFDLDGTLVDRRAAFTAWAEEFVTERRLGAAELSFLLAADARHTGPMDSFFAAVRRTFDLAESPNELWRQYRRRMPELVSCRPEDLDGLRRLRRHGWRLGIVTNGMTDNQLGKIRNTGLGKLVDGWCISGEVGIRKPDPEIFRLAVARCGGIPGRGGWMIGDDLDYDVAGGRAAGLRTIWLGAGNRRAGQPTPDFTVDSVAAAVEVLIGPGQDRQAPH